MRHIKQTLCKQFDKFIHDRSTCSLVGSWPWACGPLYLYIYQIAPAITFKSASVLFTHSTSTFITILNSIKYRSQLLQVFSNLIEYIFQTYFNRMLHNNYVRFLFFFCCWYRHPWAEHHYRYMNVHLHRIISSHFLVRIFHIWWIFCWRKRWKKRCNSKKHSIEA